jgi:phage gp16-like protein
MTKIEKLQAQLADARARRDTASINCGFASGLHERDSARVASNPENSLVAWMKSRAILVGDIQILAEVEAEIASMEGEIWKAGRRTAPKSRPKPTPGRLKGAAK